MYVQRFYRNWVCADGLHRFEVHVRESDLLITSDLEQTRAARRHVREARKAIEAAIARDRIFLTSLIPHDVPPASPPIVRTMADAARAWNVGPMAAVAGAVAEYVGRALLRRADVVVVENGGDIFARSSGPLTFAVYAGEHSPFSRKLGFSLAAPGGVGVCTSSGRVGPSFSFGKADAVVAIAADTAHADAAATAIGNRIDGPGDVERVVAEERERGALTALIACAGDRLGAFGDIELKPLPMDSGR